MNCDYIILDKEITSGELKTACEIVITDPIFKNKGYITTDQQGDVYINITGIDINFYCYVDVNEKYDDNEKLISVEPCISIRMVLHPFMDWVETIFTAKLAKYFGKSEYGNEGISELISVDSVFEECKDFKTYIKIRFDYVPLKKFASFMQIRYLIKQYPVIKDFVQ